MINILLIIIVALGIGLFTWYWLKRKKKDLVTTDDHLYDLEKIGEFVRKAFKELINANPYAGNPSEEEFNRRKNRKKELRKALASSKHGDLSAKKYVKSYIKDLIIGPYGLNEFNINQVIPFDRSERLNDQDRFEVLLHVYKKDHGKNAIGTIIQKYKLNTIKKDEHGSKRAYVSSAEINEIYAKENPKLSFEDKLEILVQRVYQMYKGLGVIDEIRDQDIDGVNGGTSGVPSQVVKSIDIEVYSEQRTYIPRSYDAVWVFYGGVSIHFEFLSFGSEKELKRVCQNIYTFGNPGQLNESRGYIVNDMADGSRILVVRPKMAESWAFFVRKHNHKIVDLKDQIKGKNANLAIKMLQFLVKAKQTVLFTGPQGSGKTTLMKAVIKYIENKNIRIQELNFELWARKLYPDKNIVSFRETTTVSAQDGMDIQKKSDGAVNIVGEIASHPVAALAIQAGGIASEFTLGSHHGNTFKKTINALRNSLIANGDFTNEKAAEQQVVSWLGFDVHTVITGTGQRYIERFTQCVPVEQSEEYPKDFLDANTLEEKVDKFMETSTEFFSRMTDRKTYEYRDILVWENDGYVVKEKLTKEKYEEMSRNMDEEDRELFAEFISTYWGEIV